MDRTDPTMRFTLPSDRPLQNRWSRKAAASDDEYEVIGLLPNVSATIKRMFGSVKAIINLAMAEHGIDGRNPFASIYMPDETPEERQPIMLLGCYTNKCRSVAIIF